MGPCSPVVQSLDSMEITVFVQIVDPLVREGKHRARAGNMEGKHRARAGREMKKRGLGPMAT